VPQASVKSYDSITRTGVLIADDGETTYEVDAEAMDTSMFRFLRPGQRVSFDWMEEDGKRQMRNLRIGVSRLPGS
jgi:cold shock CspA family protein